VSAAFRGARLRALLASGGLAAIACATAPSGPSDMALPGTGKGFAEFQDDDHACRDFAAGRTGMSPEQAADTSAVRSGAVGTAVGAASGAAIGAAAGAAGAGAAIGAGSGLLVGSAAGAGTSSWSRAEAQQRYDHAYDQCMYARGNQIPVAMAPAGPAAHYPGAPPPDAVAPPPGTPPPPR
jgi:hypothetical protein